MKCRLMLLLIGVMGIVYGDAGGQLRTNIYERAYSIFRIDGECTLEKDVMRRFYGIRGGYGMGMDLNGYERSAFSNLCAVVSNKYVEVASDWRSYSTNELVRFSVLSAIGFSGRDIYTNFTGRILSLYESFPSDDGWRSVVFLQCPYGTPMEWCLTFDYDKPGISNLIQRISAAASQHGSTNVVSTCDEMLSGESKRVHLELRANGLE